MEIFISWSGPASRSAACALKELLRQVFAHRIDVWFSDTEIEKGTRWSVELADALERAQFGLICLTKANVSSPWLLFEAGAIAKSCASSRVCPILFGLTTDDITGPLAQFQLTRSSKSEIASLLRHANAKLRNPLPKRSLDNAFRAAWPRFKRRIAKQQSSEPLPSTGLARQELIRVLRNMVTYDDFSALLRPPSMKHLRGGGPNRLPKKRP